MVYENAREFVAQTSIGYCGKEVLFNVFHVLDYEDKDDDVAQYEVYKFQLNGRPEFEFAIFVNVAEAGIEFEYLREVDALPNGLTKEMVLQMLAMIQEITNRLQQEMVHSIDTEFVPEDARSLFEADERYTKTFDELDGDQFTILQRTYTPMRQV